MIFQNENSFDEILVPEIMHRACENSIGFMVHLTNVFINDDEKLEVRGPLPIYRIFDNDINVGSDEMAVRMTSYPLGISSTFKIEQSRRNEINFDEILKLKEMFRIKMSFYYQCQLANPDTAFEDIIIQRIRRFEEVKFREKMAALDRVSKETQTWSQAKRKLDFFGFNPKLNNESEDDSPIRKKKRRRILSSSDEDETTPANQKVGTNDGTCDFEEAKVFDYSPSQLETLTKDLDINVFDTFMDQEAAVADDDDVDDDDEVFEEADNSDDDFISKEDAHDGAPGLIQYSHRQQIEFAKVCMQIINDDHVTFKFLTRNDCLKIIQQSSNIMPFQMRKIKQVISNQTKAEAEEKNLIQNLTPNFIF